MLLDRFELRAQPFGVTPDPRFLYSSATHREALAGLLYAIESGLGFAALTAPPGMGKTTLLLAALGRLGEHVRTVFLFQTIETPADLVRALLIDLGVERPQGTLLDLECQLNQLLIRQGTSGQRLVVFLDEAQHLSGEVLETVRMLSNFETGGSKRMQIVLSGQPELAERLAERKLEQLRQRISIFARLQPFSLAETAAYIAHRLAVAGRAADQPASQELFTPQAVELIAEASRGIPRNINTLCFNSLALACAGGSRTVGAGLVREALADLDLHSLAPAGSAAIRNPAAGERAAVELSRPAEIPSGVRRTELRMVEAPRRRLGLGEALFISSAELAREWQRAAGAGT